MPDEILVSVDEARRMLNGISRALFYDSVRRGTIPIVKLGRRTLVPVKGLEEAIAAITTTGPFTDRSCSVEFSGTSDRGFGADTVN